jgi:hypothetical protein
MGRKIQPILNIKFKNKEDKLNVWFLPFQKIKKRQIGK